MTTFLFLLGCAKPPVTFHGAGFDDLDRALRGATVEVATVVVVADQPAPPLPPLHEPTEIERRLLEGDAHLAPPTVLDPDVPEIASFLRNDFVGVLRFGGGLVRMGETTLEARARIIEFHQGAEMRAQGSAWLAETVADVTRGAGIVTRAAEGVAPPPVTRSSVRGSNELDGRDNLNLPRVAVAPQPMTPGGDGYLVVPYLRSYYAHNGGWFVGQEWGCSGGARVEALVVVYDRASGQPAWWQVATGRHVEEMKAQPSRAQLDQFLLYAEDEVEEALRRGFLR